MYTKGEWKVIKNDLGLLSVQDPSDRRIKIILSATREGHQAGLTTKQAHLIAASKDMYEALKYFYDHVLSFIEVCDYNDFIQIRDWFSPQDKEQIELVKQALAKAEGRND